MSMTDTLERVETIIDPEIKTSDDPGDSAHIVMVPEGEPDQTPQAYVMRARIEGLPIRALCGYTWIPEKQATGLPVCSKCLAVYQQDGKHRDERGELPDE